MVKVEGLGVINVRYLSDISFWDIPLINPKAPIVFTARVTIKNNKFIQAFLVLVIILLLIKLKQTYF
jgi:hypothetical protein